VDEHDMLKDIEKLIKRALPREVIVGFEPDPNARAQPIQRRSNDAPGRGRGQSQGRSGNGGGNRSTPASKPAAPGRSFGGAAGTARPAAPHRSGGRGR
jgi:ATP-dependent RNA helicase RhlE